MRNLLIFIKEYKFYVHNDEDKVLKEYRSIKKKLI